jgi:hypothetical protein
MHGVRDIRGTVELTRDLSSPKTREGSFRAPRHMRALFVCQRAGTRDLREFGFFGPNREHTNSTATCQCEKSLFQEVRTRRRAVLCRRVGPCSCPAGLRIQPCRPQEGTIAEVSPAVNPLGRERRSREPRRVLCLNQNSIMTYSATSLANFRPTLMTRWSEPVTSISRATSETRSPLK